jgi:hypothetical protein
MSLIRIENLPEWKETFARIRKGIESSCTGEVCTQLVRRCEELAKDGEERGVYSEAEYLTFAEEALEGASHDIEGAQLGLDLTRVHCDVGERLRSSDRLRDLGEVALRNPSDWTEANRVFVSDMTHSALSWRAEAVLDEAGLDGLVQFLQGHPYFHTKDGAFCLRSIVRRMASLALREDPGSLEVLARTFRSDPGISKDLRKARSGG